MRTIRRAVWLLLPTILVGTSLAVTASSEEIRAGVVTGLHGTASVTRASLTQPRPLAFKDDVYLRDEIVTGDASIARILLGGKALLTVRERSLVRITEAPGISTVSVSNGRAAINVVKERMRPGESVEIVTPNATAAIRGTIVVAEVAPEGAGTRSTITVLRGLIDVTQHDTAGHAVGRPVSVSALQQVIASGPRLSPVQSITRHAAERLAREFAMGPRPMPTAAPTVQSEVDRLVQQVARDTGSKGSADRPGDSSRGGDAQNADSKNDDSKAGDRSGGNSGPGVGNGGPSSGNGGSGGDRIAGGTGDRGIGGGGDRGIGNGGPGGGDRDKDRSPDRDRGNKGSGKRR
jgi:hypothetical protein